MGLFYLLIGAAMLMCIVVMLYPQIIWHMSAWQYRNPEKNEPSDLWYLTQRVGAGLGFVMLMVSCSALAPDSSSSSDSSDSSESSDSLTEPGTDGPEPGSSASPSDSVPYDGPNGREEVTTSSEYGRIASYSTSGNTLTVRLAPHDCQSTINNVSTDEKDDEVVVRSSLYGDEAACGTGPDGPISERVELVEPLGDREVVDTDGAPIPERDNT